MSETVLVTGGTGFIGAHLVRRLVAEGHEVIVLGRSPGTYGPGVRPIMAEGFERPVLRTALAGVRFNAAYHLAAHGVRPGDRDPRTMLTVNVEGALALAELAAEAGCGAFISAGSSAEYAPGPAAPFTEASPLEAQRMYGASKAAAGLLLAAFAAQAGLPCAVLRLFNAYGPGEAAHRLLPALVRNLAAGSRVALSPGTQQRDFIHVSDIVDALLSARSMLAADSRRAGHYNVATGRPTSVREFALMVAAAFGAGIDRLDFGATAMRPDEIMFVVGDPSRFNQASGWAPRLTLKEGIDQSVAALRLQTR